MIARIWHGYTHPTNADAYEQLLRTKILPGIHRVKGYQGAYLLRRTVVADGECFPISLWESRDAVRNFAGEGHSTAVVTEEARRLLAHYDEQSVHYEASWCP